MSITLLGPAEIRELAERLGVSPTKRLGQNSV
ncbi:MAG TPA: 16S rRNA (adenine(1518)-N(6)/adenine(1519)-N(6))-dimethyltransferase, partial [Terrimesophilobacter sp.]|nr:16S rRNA (adenine(1518)-N(6)/adenine(1519)-N(6))-dimethyltransferase [Terrimesophilobacter sp.]